MSSNNIPAPASALEATPAATETETPPLFDEAVDIHEPRNLFVLAAHHIVLRVAWIFKTESVIMPAFVDFIAGPGSSWLRGCLPVLNRFGQSVPPLMLADRLKHSQHKKWPLFWTTLLMAVPFVALSALMFSVSWLGLTAQRLSWLPPLFLFLYFIFFSMTGLNQMAFATLQGKLIRPNRRGRLMGLSVTFGALCAIPCAWFLLPRWLDLPDGGYGFVFAFTGIGFVVAAFITLFLIEPADDIDGLPERAKNHFRGAWDMLRRDHNFRRLAVAGMLCMTGQLLFPHYQALAREVLKAPRENLMVWVVAQNAGAGLFGFLAGAIADRWGNRLAIRLEIAAVIAAPLSALGLAAGWLPGGAAYLWTSFFLLGLTPVLMRTLMNFALELSEPADHPRYISTLKLCMAVPFVFSPLIGLLVDLAGFHIVFAAITCLIALGGVMTFRLAEPRRDNNSGV